MRISVGYGDPARGQAEALTLLRAAAVASRTESESHHLLSHIMIPQTKQAGKSPAILMQ